MAKLPAALRDVDLGPHCQKLSTKKLIFATALVFEVPAGEGAAEAAGELAGYSEQEARRLSRDRGIVAAVKELMDQKLVLHAAPMAINTLMETMENVASKDRTKAASIILDRVLPVKSQLTVETTTIDRTAETLKHLEHLENIGVGEDALVKEFGTLGLQHYRGLLAQRRADQAKLIEGEATEVQQPDDPADTLEDIL